MKTNFECDFVNKVSENEFPVVYFRIIWALSLPFNFFILLMFIYIMLILFKKAKWNVGYLLTLVIFIILDFQSGLFTLIVKTMSCINIGGIYYIAEDI